MSLCLWLKLARIVKSIIGTLVMTKLSMTIFLIEVSYLMIYCFLSVNHAITSRLPSAVVIRNQVPKAYLNYDIYCNLIPNDDESNPVYDQVPRTGSFEVSYKGMVSNDLFRKCYLK